MKLKMWNRARVEREAEVHKSQEEAKQRTLDEAREVAFGRGMTQEEMREALSVPYQNVVLRAVVNIIRAQKDVASANAMAKPMDETAHLFTAQAAALVDLEEKLLGVRDWAVANWEKTQAEQGNKP